MGNVSRQWERILSAYSENIYRVLSADSGNIYWVIADSGKGYCQHTV